MLYSILVGKDVKLHEPMIEISVLPVRGQFCIGSVCVWKLLIVESVYEEFEDVGLHVSETDCLLVGFLEAPSKSSAEELRVMNQERFVNGEACLVGFDENCGEDCIFCSAARQ